MKSILLKLNDKSFEEKHQTVKAKKSKSNNIKVVIECDDVRLAEKAIKEQISREIELLSQFDPDRELRAEFEAVSINDLPTL